jgi:hypothetical protein
MKLFETSPDKQKRLRFGFATALFFAGAIIFILSKGIGLFRLSGLILLTASARLYPRARPGLATDSRPNLRHLKALKMLARGSLLAACATLMYLFSGTASHVTLLVYLFVGLTTLCFLCWSYIGIANRR